MIVFRQGDLVYLVGRALALGARPAFLLICNHFFGNVSAGILASVFLVSAVSNTVANVDSHRIYYARHFGDAEGLHVRTYILYVFSQLIVGAGAALGCAVYFWVVEGDGWLATISALFTLSERLADEALRFKLFQTARNAWGRLMIVRISVQSIMVGVVALSCPTTRASAYFISAMFFGNIVAFWEYIPLRFIGRSVSGWRMATRHLSASLSLIRRSGTIWMLSLATMFSGYLDRLIVLTAAKTDLAIFTLIVSSLSIVQTAIDYFYFSPHRRDFLDGKINFWTAVRSQSFQIIVCSSLIVGLILAVLNISLYRGAPTVPFAVIALVAVIQVALGMSLIVREIAYWNNQLKAILRVEIVFLGLIALILGALGLFRLHYAWLVLAAMGAILLRLLMMLRISTRRLPIK